MKKKIISFALAAIVSLGISSIAAPRHGHDSNRKCDRKENCDCQRQSCDSARQCMLFDGIQLTQQQKDALTALKAKKAECRKAECKKADCKKTDCKKNADPAKCDRRARRCEGRAEFLKQVKTILTPDQYQKFLENSFIYAGGQKGGKHAKKFDKCRGDRKDCRPSGKK